MRIISTLAIILGLIVFCISFALYIKQHEQNLKIEDCAVKMTYEGHEYIQFSSVIHNPECAKCKVNKDN